MLVESIFPANLTSGKSLKWIIQLMEREKVRMIKRLRPDIAGIRKVVVGERGGGLRIKRGWNK